MALAHYFGRFVAEVGLAHYIGKFVEKSALVHHFAKFFMELAIGKFSILVNLSLKWHWRTIVANGQNAA